MADRFHPSALLGKRVYWLLDFKYAGMTIRLSDAELDVLTDAGESLHYHGSIETINVDEGLDFLSDASAAPTSASIDVILPVDVPLLIARGHDLGGATATLSRWIEGTTHESARPVISGGVRDPSHGDADEPISFTLELTPWSDSRVIPSPALTVTGANLEDDWVLSLPAESLGLAYPIVIGKPGVVSTAIHSSGKITGSQAVPLRLVPFAHNTIWSGVLWLLAGHHVTATRVWINSDAYPTAVRVPVFNGRDRAGHPIAMIPWWTSTSADTPAYPYDWDKNESYQDAIEPDSDGLDTHSAGSYTGPGSGSADDVIDQLRLGEPPAIYAIWQDDIGGGGGMRGLDGTTMRGAGDVIEWLLGQSGAPVDRGRFAAMKPLLNAYKLDFTIDAEVTPWEFLKANIIPLLPMSLVSGPGGIYPVVWRYDATARDAVGRLDLSSDPYIERASAVTQDRSGVVNDFSIKYAYSVRTGEYQGLAHISGGSAEYDGVGAKKAKGSIEFTGIPLAGTTVTIGGAVLTATYGVPGTDEYGIDILSKEVTAFLLYAAIINPANAVYAVVDAAGFSGPTVHVTAPTAGTAGNAITLADTATNITLSGATLSGGAASRLVMTDKIPSLYCDLSQRRYRDGDGEPLVVQETIEALCVYETATALAILGWMSRAKCLAKRRVEYLAPEAVYGWLERGQVVTLTDPSLRYSDTVAVIEAIGTDGSAMLRIKLLLIEAPERDARLV